MVTLVVPTYNERENIVPLLKQVTKLVDHVIVVDDNSPDGTGMLSKNFSDSNSVKTIIRPGKMGLSGAILRGVTEAEDEDIIVMDSDFSHPPETIISIKEALKNHDIVVASRNRIKGWGLKRHLMSKAANALAQTLLFRGKVPDPMSGFFGLKKAVFLKYRDKVSPNGYKILFTIVRNYVRDHGYSGITNVDYTFVNRRFGESKLSMNQVFDYVRSIFRSGPPRKIPILGEAMTKPFYVLPETYIMIDRSQAFVRIYQ